MSWFDTMQQGSLNGIPFFADSSGAGGFRRNVIHRPYGVNYAVLQDTGTNPRSFVLDAYIVGPNYHIDRDRMEAVFRTVGPYRLVHHLRGGPIFVAHEGDPVFTETKEQGGMVRFSVTLVEINRQSFGLESLPSPKQLTKALKQATQQSFIASYTKPKGGFFKKILKAMYKAVTIMNSANGKIAASAMVFTEFSAGIRAFNDQLDKFLSSPQLFVSGVFGVMSNLFNLFNLFQNGFVPTPGKETIPPFGLIGTVVSAVGDFMAMNTKEFDANQKKVKPTQGIIEYRASLEAVSLLVKVAAIQEGAAVLVDPDTIYTSANEAEEARDKMAAYMDQLSFDYDMPPEQLSSLRSLRTAVYRTLTDVAQNLPRLYTYTVTRNVPAVVLAYELYGDIRREDEIIAQNKIVDPFFVMGGTELEVLSNA